MSSLNMMQIRNLNPNRLREMYKKEKLTMAQIAQKTGVSRATISQRLREYGIKKVKKHAK
jgi:transcriptional regulator with XRE-family HTH domain